MRTDPRDQAVQRLLAVAILAERQVAGLGVDDCECVVASQRSQSIEVRRGDGEQRQPGIVRWRPAPFGTVWRTSFGVPLRAVFRAQSCPRQSVRRVVPPVGGTSGRKLPGERNRATNRRRVRSLGRRGRAKRARPWRWPSPVADRVPARLASRCALRRCRTSRWPVSGRPRGRVRGIRRACATAGAGRARRLGMVF